MTEPHPFNPLDLENIAESLIRELESREAVALGNVEDFRGAGLYAVYYVGNFEAYKPLARLNHDALAFPIYIGKAEPAGSRKGIAAENLASTKSLSKRIREHRSSVASARNLDLADFYVRWLVTEPLWIKLGESALIRRYRPVWNALIDGFGNHAPGKGRTAGRRPRWDTLHPGRSWAEDLSPIEANLDEMTREAHSYLTERLPLQSPNTKE